MDYTYTVPGAPNISAQVLASAANFLSSLKTDLEGMDANTSPFAAFLAQNQIAAAPPPSPDVAASPAIAAAQDDTPPSQTSFPALKQLLSVLRDILHKPHKQDSGSKSDGKSRTAATETDHSTSNPASVPLTPTSAATAATPTSTSAGNAGGGNNQLSQNSTATGSTSGSAATTVNVGGDTSPTVFDLLVELQRLELAVERQLQALSSSSGGTTDPRNARSANAGVPPTGDLKSALSTGLAASLAHTSNSGSAQNSAATSATTSAAANNAISFQDAALSASDPLTPEQALTDLLALTRLIAQKLQGTQTDSETDMSGNGITTQTSNIPASTSQIETGLNALLQSLKADIATASAASTKNLSGSASQVPSNDVTATTSASDVLVNNASSAVNDSHISNTSDMARVSRAQQENPFNFFNADMRDLSNDQVVGTPTFVAISADAYTANAGDKQGPSLDFDLDSGGQGASTLAQDASGTNLGNAGLNALPESNQATAPYSFASQLSATRATNGGMVGLPPAIEQVILQLNRNVKTGNDQMTLQLSPAELGRINIKLDFTGDGKVQGTVVADNPATLHLLLKDVRSLERALQDAGLRADPGSLQFSLGGQPGNSSGQMDGNTSKTSGNGDGVLSDTSTGATDVPGDAAETWYLTPGGVNMKV